jgi:hypothetical protein
VVYFNYLGSIITRGARCTCRVKTRIAIPKAAFNKEKALLASKFDLCLRKKLTNCCIWSVDLHGAEAWTLQKKDHKHPESLKYGSGKGWTRSLGPPV